MPSSFCARTSDACDDICSLATDAEQGADCVRALPTPKGTPCPPLTPLIVHSESDQVGNCELGQVGQCQGRQEIDPLGSLPSPIHAFDQERDGTLAQPRVSARIRSSTPSRKGSARNGAKSRRKLPQVAGPSSPSGDNLLKLYNCIPSPPAGSGQVLDAILGHGHKLYQYQTDSVICMLQREAPEVWCGEAAKIDDVTIQTRGGILCQDMGTGKTAMCIALIACTRDMHSLPPPDAMETRLHSTVTEEESELTSRGGPRSLVNMCVDRLITCGGRRPWPVSNDAFKAYPTWSQWAHYTDTPWGSRVQAALLSRHFVYTTMKWVKEGRDYDIKSETIHTSKATLIIVPDQLLYQWTMEFSKHLEVSLMLAVVGKSSPMPSELEIGHYHAVLTSIERLAQEVKKPTTPLRKVHFLRIIIDEGHCAANSSSMIMNFIGELRAEFRTPTHNLALMDDPAALSDGNNDGPGNVDFRNDLTRLGLIFRTFLKVEPFVQDSRLFSRTIVAPYLQGVPGAREKLLELFSQLMVRHTKQEIRAQITLPPVEDHVVRLEPTWYDTLAYNVQLALMASNFILTERRHQDYLFHPRNSKALRNAVRNLQLATTFSAHENVHDLLEYHQNTLDGIVRLSQGKLQGKDSDMIRLLSASNVLWGALGHLPYLQVARVRDLGMYVKCYPMRSEDARQWALPVVQESEEQGEKQRRLPVSMQRPAILPANTIEELMNLFELPVPAMPSLQNGKQDASDTATEESIGSPISVPRSSKQSNGTVQRQRNALSGAQTSASKKRKHDEIEAAKVSGASGKSISTGSSKPVDKLKVRKANHGEIEGPLSSLTEQGAQVVNTCMAKHMATLSMNGANYKLYEHDRHPEVRARVRDMPLYYNALDHRAFKHLHKDSGVNALRSQMLDSIVTHTVSAKLNYLARRLVAITPTEKCIVFAELDVELFYVSQMCDLLSIPSLIFAKGVKGEMSPAEAIREFRTSTYKRVFIMRTSFAARGIDLSVASAVFFLSPVWNIDVQRQAVRRAHRIGQQRPVRVETLVIRGAALEEWLVARRHAGKTFVSGSGTQKLNAGPRAVESSGNCSSPASPGKSDVSDATKSLALASDSTDLQQILDNAQFLPMEGLINAETDAVGLEETIYGPPLNIPIVRDHEMTTS